MEPHLKTLLVDASSGLYRFNRFPVGEFFGPVDLGLHFTIHHNSLNIGTGLMAGSIFPGSNRLVFTGNSPCWGGFYISSMGGAGLVFDNLGIDFLAITGRTHSPSVLLLNRTHGEEIQVKIFTIDVDEVWNHGRGGVYAMTDHVYHTYASEYSNDPRVLAVGKAARTTDFAGIMSVPIRKGEVTNVDTWAGRGGFGSKMFREHGIAAIIYGGTFLDEDFRDRTVADQWFEDKYNLRLAAKDIEATTKYRYDAKFNTGGTFGVNYATMGGRVMAFNYNSIFWNEQERVDLHKNLITDHYLKQFNEETIQTKQQANCGEPCAAVCKKMNGVFKKDYEPYQTMGPLCGIFDQRAAENLNHHADMLGFDAISAGGVLAWLMECLDKRYFTPEDLGVDCLPVFSKENFAVETDSMHNSKLGIQLLDSIVEQKGIVDMSHGARRWARKQARVRGRELIDCFLYNSFGRRGWMVPNQYWTPGVLSPMPIMGKYYMHYGPEFLHPRIMGRKNAERFRKELILDNLGICRFHRMWAEDMMPDIVEKLYGLGKEFIKTIEASSYNINSRNSSMLWESWRNVDFLETYLHRRHDVEGDNSPELMGWIDYLKRDRKTAAIDYWYEIHKGISEVLNEF